MSDYQAILKQQLYSQTHFQMPVYEFQQLSNPFRKFQYQKLFRQDLSSQPYPQTCKFQFSHQFEAIIAQEGLYPLYLDLYKDKLFVMAKDNLLSCPINTLISENLSNKKQLTQNVKQWNISPFPDKEIPNIMKIGNRFAYFGFNSGRIMQYDLQKQCVNHIAQQFTFPVMQIEIIQQNSQTLAYQIIAMDSIGNVKILVFTHKTFFDRIIKVLVSVNSIRVQQQLKTKQKLKKMFIGFVSKQQNSLVTLQNNYFAKFCLLNKIQGKQTQITVAVLHPERVKKQKMQQNEQITYSGYGVSIISYDKKKGEIIFLKKILENLNSPGMMCFGQGGFQFGNTTYLLFLVSHGYQMYYFRAIDVEGIYQWHLVSENPIVTVNNTQQQILEGYFISNNLILYISKQHMYIGNVKQPIKKFYKLDFQKFSYIDFFNSEQEFHFNFDKRLVRRNMLKNWVDKVKSSYFCLLQGKRLAISKFMFWEEYLEEIINKGNWKDSMKYCLMVYKGYIKKLAGVSENIQVRKKSMQTYFEKITITYLSKVIATSRMNQHIMKQNSIETQISVDMEYKAEENQRIYTAKNDEVRQAIDIVINFLIEAQCQFSLFTTIYEEIDRLGQIEIFHHQLWKYVQSGSIKFMTEKVLFTTIQHYQSINRVDVLNALIMNFDLQIIEKSLLLSVCLSQGLYEGMIYICTEEKQYITPIIKLCGFTTQKSKDFQVKKSVENIMFYYIKQCLEGKRTQFGNQKQYIAMLQQFLNFFFIPSSIEMLSNISYKKTITIIEQFFMPKVMQTVLQNEDLRVRKKIDFERIFIEKSPKQYEIYEGILVTLIFTYQKISKEMMKNQDSPRKYRSKSEFLQKNQQNQLKSLKPQLCQCHGILTYELNKYLTFLVLKNQLPFCFKIRKQAVIFFISHACIFFKPQTQQDQINLNSSLMRMIDATIRSLIQQIKKGEQLQNNHDAQHQNNQLMNRNFNDIERLLKDFLIAIDISNYHAFFSEVVCYLHHYLNDPSKTILTYLQMKNKKMRNRIFEYLNYNLNEKNLRGKSKEAKQKFIQILSEEIVKSIQSLVGINKDQIVGLAYKIIILGIAQSEELIIRLSHHPDLQLKIIQQILAANKQKFRQAIFSNQVKNHNFSEKSLRSLALCHLRIISKNNPEKLEENILKIDYPLQQAYEVCEKQGNKSAMAYILIKNGRNVEGINMLTDIFITQTGKYLRVVFNKEKNLSTDSNINLEQQQNRLMTKLEKVLETCTNQYKNDAVKGEENWIDIVGKIVKGLRFQSNIDNPDKPAMIKNILKKIIQRIMKEIFDHTSTDFFLHKFMYISVGDKQKNSLPSSILLEGFRIVLLRLHSQENQNTFANMIIRKDQVKIFHEFVKATACGFNVGKMCGNGISEENKGCDRSLLSQAPSQSSNIISFNRCGHSYHKQCHQQLKCKICSQDNNRVFQQTLNMFVQKSLLSFWQKYDPNFKKNWQNNQKQNEQCLKDQTQYSKKQQQLKKIEKMQKYDELTNEQTQIIFNSMQGLSNDNFNHS